MEELQNNKKYKVPQECLKTGISQDYTNYFNGLASCYMNAGMEGLKQFVSQKGISFRIKKYEEVYSPYIY